MFLSPSWNRMFQRYYRESIKVDELEAWNLHLQQMMGQNRKRYEDKLAAQHQHQAHLEWLIHEINLVVNGVPQTMEPQEVKALINDRVELGPLSYWTQVKPCPTCETPVRWGTLKVIHPNYRSQKLKDLAKRCLDPK